MVVITVRRGTSYADRFRAYNIVLDGAVIGKVKRGESVELQASPGHHAIMLKIDWCRSNEVEFNVGLDEKIYFECGSSLTGWKVLLAIFYLILLPHKYLWLQQVSR